MRRSAGTLIFIVLLAMVPFSLMAQEGPVLLTLDEAIAKAMSANYHIQSLQAGTQAKKGQAQAEKNRNLGELMLSGGVALHGDDTLIRPITQEMMLAGPSNMPFDDQFAFWSLSYRLPIYNGGTLGGIKDSARRAASASEKTTNRVILGTRHQVLATYVTILSLDAQLVAWQNQNEALNSLVSHIELGKDAGKFSRVDLLKTKVEQQNVSMKTQSLEQSRATSYASLMALLGETGPEQIQYKLVPIDDAEQNLTVPSFTALVDSALANRGDLQAMKEMAAAQNSNVRVVNGSRLPQVSVGGNFSGSHGGNIDFDDTFWSVNATVSIPLLDMGRRKNMTVKAEMTARSAELDVLDKEGKIRAEVTAVLAAFATAKRNILTQQITLELATEVSRLEELRYNSGRGDIDNLLKSKAGKSLAEASLAGAKYNLVIALNNLQLTIEGECR